VLENLVKRDEKLASRILDEIDELTKRDIPVGNKLKGRLKGYYRCRVGDYGIIYGVEKDTVKIKSIGHRKDIYKKPIYK